MGLAQIVDEEFQASVQTIFEIDQVTSKGTVALNVFGQDEDEKEVSGDGVVEYTRGPVKLMERARSKAQNDYSNEPYPASACVIDFNRCALIFEDISSLLRGLNLFVNKVKHYQSGNIIAIARGKNGFIEYVKEAQYADIKLNVVIKGKHNSIIGEVQFLLRAMKEYKNKAHNLYAIQRQEEGLRSSVSVTLPILINQRKDIMSVACRGSWKKMCSLMILQNQSIEDLMFAEEESGCTIFHMICQFSHLELLKFLESMMSRQEFIDHIFTCDTSDNHPMDFAVSNSNSSIIKHLFVMKEVQDRYKDNDPLIYRLFLFLFAINTNPHITEYVLSTLQISKDKIISMLSYECPKQSENSTYHKFNILTGILGLGTLDHLKRLIDMIGEQAFIDNLFCRNKYQADVMYWAIRLQKINVIEYILTFEEVKKKYMSDIRLLHYLCTALNEFIENIESVKCVVDGLGITEAKLEEVKEFQEIDISKILPLTK